MDEFVNRINAQKRILRIVNSVEWENERLISLNAKAINRWIMANKIDPDSRLIEMLFLAGERLFSLATRSQEQISQEYQASESAVTSITNDIEAELQGMCR